MRSWESSHVFHKDSLEDGVKVLGNSVDRGWEVWGGWGADLLVLGGEGGVSWG